MAVRKKAATTPQGAPKKRGLTDNQRWGYGFLLLFVALFVLASVVSFFLFWRDDQSLAQWGDMFDSQGAQVLNWGGKLGAVTGNYIVSEWFGLFGLCIPLVLVVLALRIMRYRPMFLRKSVRLTLILMILGSVSLGFLFGDAWALFGTGLGGAHGIYIAQWLSSLLGVIGTALLLVVALVIYAVYINRNTISVVNRVGKGILENSKKVGEVVSGAAGSIIAHDKDTQTAGAEQTADDSEREDRPASPPAVAVAAREPQVDEDGFVIRSLGEDFYADEDEADQPAALPQAQVDEDGFMIVDRTGERGETALGAAGALSAAALQESGGDAREMQVDDDGFVIVQLTPEEESTSAALAVPVASSATTSSLMAEVDEHGFMIERPMGDSEPAPGVLEPTGFVASVPSDLQLEGRQDLTIDRLPGEHQLTDEEIEMAPYDPTLDLGSYQRPTLDLLEDHSVEVSVTSEEIVANKNRIKDTLENFGIKIDKIKATIGPTVTLYEIVPAPGVRISKIKNLEDDIALSLSALGIRIIAPIPGKGTIGIEVPNKDKKVVSMYSVIKSVKFQESTFDIPVVLGKTIQDETFVIDLAKMPHLLVAGATGQGKSVGLNAIITSLLYKKHPSELKLVLIDPKKVELTLYSKLERHFLAKLPGEDDAIITDTHKVIYTLNSLCIEMDARYDLLRKAEVRHVKEYNAKFISRKLNPNKGHRYLPYIIVVIDEFADLIMTAGREVETPIARIAQLARAVGIHLVIATQRPTTNIITGVIKANFPARIAFRVTSMIDSRTIIDQPGANQLIGRGDMLVSTGNELIRVQCAFVDTPEIEQITQFISNQRGYSGAYELPDYQPDGGSDTAAGGNKTNDLSQLDVMFEEVSRFVVQNQQGSTSSIQRRFSIGYNRAGRIMDQLEMAGVVGRAEGSKPREVLLQDIISLEQLFERLKNY